MTFSAEPAGDATGSEGAEPSLAQRAPRSATMLLVSRVTGPRHDTLCRISNVAIGGLRAEGPVGAFAVGEDVSVEVRHAHLLSGRVVWVDGGAFGIRFDDRLDVEGFLASLASMEPSADGRHVRPPRLPTNCTVEVRAWGRIHRPAMTDLSQRGARLAMGSLILQPETLVRLAIPGLATVRAAVRWVHEEECGVAFLETVGLGQLAQWFMDPALRHGTGSIRNV